MFHPIILTYLILCLLVSLFARRSSLGFFRCFTLCVLLSPFLMGIVVLIQRLMLPRACVHAQAPHGSCPER